MPNKYASYPAHPQLGLLTVNQEISAGYAEILCKTIDRLDALIDEGNERLAALQVDETDPKLWELIESVRGNINEYVAMRDMLEINLAAARQDSDECRKKCSEHVAYLEVEYDE